jgi:hypothetical protein
MFEAHVAAVGQPPARIPEKLVVLVREGFVGHDGSPFVEQASRRSKPRMQSARSWFTERFPILISVPLLPPASPTLALSSADLF